MITLLYRIYQLFIVLPIFLISTILTSLITVIGSLIGDAHFWGYYPGKYWSWLTCHLFLLPVRIKGKELLDKKTSYVFVANHQGPMDIFLIYGFLGRNFKWMMKKSLQKMPFIGIACTKAHHIFVDKSGPKKIQETIEHARETLQDGTSLVVFPEGARTYTGRMSPFRKGAFQLADDLQLPIVPITINGSFNVLTRMEGFNFVHFHSMELIIHQPIPPRGKGHDDIQQRMDEAYRIIQQDLAPEYKDDPDQHKQ